MDRISTTTKAADLFGAGKHGWKDGNLGLGIAPTDLNAEWFNGVQEELLELIENEGLVASAADREQVRKGIELLVRRIAMCCLVVQDQKTANTSGGNSAVGMQTRTLNTVVANTIPGASLASNQITLPAGTYRVKAHVPCGANSHRSHLRNVTDASVAALGTSCNAATPAEAFIITNSDVQGRFTIAATKVFDIRTFADEVRTTGLGAPVNDGNVEVYTTVEIVKEA